MEEGEVVLEEVDREADFLEQMHSPRKNVWHLGFVFFAVLALRSGGYIETCDIYREKDSCRCSVLPELHKTISVPPRPSDARDATTQCRDLKHTKCHHLDTVRSITKSESMCSTSLSRHALLDLECYLCGNHIRSSMDCERIRDLRSPSSHACLGAFVHGWTRWAGWPRLARFDRGTHNRGVFGSTLAKNTVAIRPAGLEV